MKIGDFGRKALSTSSVANLSHRASTLFVYSTFAVIQRVARVCQRQLIPVTIIFKMLLTRLLCY